MFYHAGRQAIQKNCLRTVKKNPSDNVYFNETTASTGQWSEIKTPRSFLI